MKLLVELIQFSNTTIDGSCAIVRFLTTIEPVLQLMQQQIIDTLDSLTMEPQRVPDSDLHQILNIIRVDQLMKFSEKTSGT